MKGWTLSGKHADTSELRLARQRLSGARRFVPLISALVIAGVVVGASIAAMNLGPTTDTPTAAGAVSTASPSPSASTGHGTDERASRSGMRAIPPASPTPTPTPASAPSSKKPAPPSGGGNVTSSGQCPASFYSDGQKTANGETFDPNAFTAANKTMPFNTRVRVTNVANGKSTVVRINDRGPYSGNRCLDLSRAAFGAIANLSAGVINVKYEVLS
jgi:rare lipoprotein A